MDLAPGPPVDYVLRGRMQLHFGEFRLDTDAFELRQGEDPRTVEPLVFDLLCFFAQRAGRVLSRAEIIDQVWGGRIVSEATVSSCIKSARKALGDDGDSQTYIRTVRGRGYQFVPEVNVVEERTSTAAATEEAAPAAAPPVPKDVALERPTSAKPILAVLPFENRSAETDEYFADGLTEDILTNLSRFRDLLVIGRSSSFRFKGQDAGIAAIRESLGADFVVEGSVRRAAGRVRISVQLVDATTSVQLWADRYDREMEDIFAVQDEVTRTIAATLGVRLQDVATQRALRKNAAALGAYDCVLRARRYTADLSDEMHAEARDLLERAVEQDPSNAEAHALLANVYLAEHRFNANTRSDSIDRALRMAETATRLDPHNAYARCWLGIVYFFRHEMEKFEEETRRAIDLNPNDPEILADVGHFLAFMGEFERGLALSKRARELNPLHPGWYHFTSVRSHYAGRAYQEVLADVEQIGMPHFYWCHVFRAAALGQLGRTAEAERALARIYELEPGFCARVELEKWNAAPYDFDHLLEGLRKAGLDK